MTIQEQYPEATERDIDRIKRLRRGDDYLFRAPDVCPALWDELAWSRWVHFKREKDDE